MIEPVTVNLIGLARDLNLPSESVSAVVELLAEGNPIPFVARYRKDATGNMNEEQIRAIDARYREQKLLAERKISIIRSLENTGSLTPDLEKKIRSARNSRRLTDLYLPYKQPKQSFASISREKGLQPLADEILAGTAGDLTERAAAFINPEKDLATAEDVLKGAGYIISEQYNVSPELRRLTREVYERTGKLISKKIEPKNEDGAESVEEKPVQNPAEPVAEVSADPQSAAEVADAPAKPENAASDGAKSDKAKADKKTKKDAKKKDAAKQRRAQEEKLYSDFFNFTSDIRNCPAHRVLAVNRGESGKFLRVKLSVDEERVSREGKELLIPADHPYYEFLGQCLDDALTRLLLPSMEREIRRELTDNAKKQAVKVFDKNLRNLLLQKPLFRHRVLAVDPGFRYGCKLAALDEFGNFLGNDTAYITGGPDRQKRAMKKIAAMIEKFHISVIAIGNGTGCREAEELITKMIADRFAESDVAYIIVNEAGASVYSVSQTAQQEFPEQDPLVRGAISIGRRLQDPLNELVKIEPASMGVGIYQHDLKAKDLKESLAGVVESAVNYVGVDLNCATSAILRYVAGLNQLTAKRIAEYRRANGPFRYRRDLMNVPGFGETAFTHAAGFLKISDGYEPLDATWIHPESYELAEKILDKVGFEKDDLRKPEKHAELVEKLDALDLEKLAEEFSAGQSTLADILEQLKRPGRDPRESLPAPIFKKGVMKIENLEPGMELLGTVLNVVDFGAFVDIGLHNPGLVHISRMGDRFVPDAHQRLAVGDVIKVWVVQVEPERQRISLTMISPDSPRRPVRSKDEGNDSRPRRRPSRTPESGEEQGEKREPRGDRRRPRPQRSAESRSDHASSGSPSAESRPQRPRRERSDDDSRRDRRDRFSGPRQPRVLNLESTIQKTDSLSNEMKQGKEPLRSFSDLARLLSQKTEEENPEGEKTE